MLARAALSVTVLTACIVAGSPALAQTSVCDQAKASFAQRHWQAAADQFRDCETAQAGATPALLLEGKALINLNRFDEAAVALQAYLVQHPNSDDALYSLAYVRFRQDKPRESLQLFNDAVKLKPPTADDLKIVSLDYVLLHDYTEAARYLEESLKIDPNNVEACYHLGRVRYQLNQFDSAIAAFLQVLALDPTDIKAQDNLGLSYEAKNQVDRALAAYKKAIQLDRASLTHNAQPYLDLGSLLVKLNRGEEAIPLLEQATEIDANSGKAQYELAKALFNLGRAGGAREPAESAVRLEPADSSYHYLLARIYQRLGKSDLAAQQFKLTEGLIKSKGTDATANGVDSAAKGEDSVAKTADSNVQNLRTQARSAAGQGELEKALSLLLQARNQSPNDPDVLYEFGMVALRMGLYPDAVQAFEEALAVRKNDPDALYGVGRAEIGLTRYHEARDTFARYLQLRPRDASGHYALGLALAPLQLSAEARKQFEASIALQPIQTESYFQLGLLDLDDKQLDLAADNFKLVLARDPHHAGALTGMGRVEFEKKEYAKAADFLSQAIAADPKLRQPHYYLGLTYARLAQKEESAKELQIASTIEHEEEEKQRLGLKIVDSNLAPAANAHQ